MVLSGEQWGFVATLGNPSFKMAALSLRPLAISVRYVCSDPFPHAVLLPVHTHDTLTNGAVATNGFDHQGPKGIAFSGGGLEKEGVANLMDTDGGGTRWITSIQGILEESMKCD